MVKFTIPLPPVTKKNSQRIVKAGTRRIVLPSQKYEDYEKAALWYIPRREKIAEPVEVTARFYMPTRRRVDLVNLLEALDDVLVASGLLVDDNCHIIVSHDGSRVLYDKENPRTEVAVRGCEETFGV